MFNALWRIELLGWLRATHDDRVVSRFRTHKTGALLAYLAYHGHRSHPREVLIEFFWPETSPPAGRQSLRKALSSLRLQLEPPGVPAGAVLRADHATVQLNPVAVTTDVAEFEAALRAAAHAGSATERVRWLGEAVHLYSGELLPGYYSDWIVPERQRLAEAYLQALEQLIALLEEAGDLHGALQWARRAVAADALREEAHAELIRLLAAAGQPEAALCQYRELERLLAEELGATPSPELRQLVRELEREGGRALKQRRPVKEKKPTGRAALTREKPGAGPGTSSHSRATLIPGAQELAVSPSTDGRLPLQFTRFFGREEEIARLKELLLPGERCLVTLTGPGGSGKTRLALETARQLLKGSHPSVWFVPLLDLTDPEMIIDQVLGALRLPRSPQIEPLEQVIAFLSRRPSLLLLDNFEHLVTEGSELLQKLRERVGTLSVLVTSRQRLGLPGEREIPVLPLPTPVEGSWLIVDGPTRARRSDPPTLNHQLSTLTQCLSVALFVDRAQAVRADFQLTRGSAAAVAGLCQRLEGLPLALELAAARANVLTPQQMLTRLSQRFDLLVTRQREADPRHRSLRATLDWSYRLLSPHLQQFFAQLSVFRGGWTLEAAEVVCEQPEALDFLTQLRECTLVQAEERSGEMRFRVLETLREFGRDQMSPDDQAALARRHAAYYLAVAQQAETEWCSPAQEGWVERLEADHGNLRAALAWCLTGSGDMELGLRMGAALWWFWHLRDHDSEGREHLERLLARAEGVPPAVRARAQACAGLFSSWQGDLESASSLSQESLAIARSLGDQWTMAFSLRNLGQVALFRDDFESARVHWEEGLSIWREMGDKWGIAMSCDRLCCLAQRRHDWTVARALAESGLALRRELGDPQGLARALEVMGDIARSQGDLAAARSLYEESLAIRRGLKCSRTTAFSHSGLGLICYDQGELEEARVHLEESLGIQRDLGNRHFIATALIRLAQVVAAQGHMDLSRSLLQESLLIGQEIGDRWCMGRSLQLLGDLARREGDGGQAAALSRRALDIAEAMDDGECIAHCLTGAAAMAAAQEQRERAVRLLGAAAVLRESLGCVLPRSERVAHERLLTAQRPLLGEAVFRAAWEAGRALTLEQVTAEAKQALG